jgi:hypothetical protein
MESEKEKRLGVDAHQWKMKSKLHEANLMNCDMKMLDIEGV